jgi:Tfp pilus assembly protein PilO
MSRNIIIIAVATSLLTLYVMFISPLDEKREAMKDELFVQYKSLLKHEEFISSTQNAQEELEKARAELEKKEKHIINASDVSLAFAELQAKVQDMADQSGMTITQLKPLQAEQNESGYSRLPLFMDCWGKIWQLSKFLNFLDSTPEFLAIDRLQITVGRQGSLRIKIQLSGLMKS